MPGGDGTGPWGQGSRTGRGLGYCAGYETPGFTKGPGRGMGRGWWQGRGLGLGRGPRWGRGLGWNWGYTSPMPVYPSTIPRAIPNISPESQLSMLKQEKDYLSSELDAIKNAIDDISKKIQELETKE